jgi:hypothetical protein
MLKNTAQLFLGGLALWTMSLACVIPGLQTASPSAPTVDLDLLNTMVADNVSVMITQTAMAASEIVTFETPTPSATPTPTPEPAGSGSLLTKQEDGTTLFIDQRGGYQLSVPAGWLAVRINEQEYLDAWSLAEAADPAVQRSLTGIQNLDPNQFRLFAYDTQDGHIQGGFVTNINVVWDPSNQISLDEAGLNAAVESLVQTVPGMDVTSAQITVTSSGIPIGVVTSDWPSQTTVDGATISITQKQVYLSAGTGSLVITFSTTVELKETTLPAFDSMIETIRLSGQ